MKKVITTMLVAAMVLSMAMPTSAATITRKKSTGTTASTTKVSGDYSLKMVDKTLQFIRGGKVVSSIETKDGKITLRKSSAGGVSVVFTDANGKRRNITLGKQNSVALSGTFVQVSVDKALGSSFEVEMEKGSKVTNFYAKGAAKVTLNGSVTTLNVTSSNANVAANGTVSRAYAVNKKAISGMSSGKITQTSTGTSASGSVNTSTGSSSSSNTTVNNGSGSGNGSTSGGSNGIIINGGGSNGGTVVTTTAAKEAAKITTAKIGTASVKVGATNAEVKAAVEAKAKILVTSGYTVTFNQTKAADTSKAGATSVTGTFTVSKGSDKATTKAMTISVNVTAVTVPAVIEKVVAENGLVNIVLENNPSVTPTDANFNPVIKAYINGGAAADLAGLKFESYEEASKTVVYSFTKIAATDEDQSVVVGAKLGSANEVKADAFKVPAIVKAEIAAVKATNGTIDIELVENPSTDVTAESFAPVIKAYIDGAEGIDLKDVAFVKYDSTTKTVSYTFTPIEATDAEQNVVVGAKLGSADEVKAEAFKVPAKGATVEAEIVSVTAENGKISVVLKENPTTEPTGENFTPVIKAYINGSETGADLTGLTFGEYNSTTKTVSYTFTNIPATDADQTVVIGVKLADAVEVQSNEFKIDAATTEAEAGDITVTVATGANKTTFVEGDEDAYLEATVTLAENTTGTLGDLTYQWLRGTNSNIVDAKPIADANLAKYELKADNQIGNGSYYFCKVVNTVGTTTKEKASQATSYLKVTYPENAAETPAFSKNIVPATDDRVDTDAYIQGAGSVTPLTVTVNPPSSDTAVVTYKWFVTNDKSKAGSEIEGASGTLSATNSWTASYTPKTTAAEAGTNYYYCEVTNTDEAATPTNPDYKAITVKSEVATIVVKSNLSIVAKANGSNTEDSTKITVSFSNKGAINIPLDAFTIADETIPEGETSKISLGGMPVQVEGGISYELPLAGAIPTNGHKVIVTIDASKLPEGVSLISNTAVVALNKNMSVTSTATVSKVEAVNGTDGTVDTTKVKVIFDSPVYATNGTSDAPYDAFTFDNFVVSSTLGSVETNANKTEYTLTGRPDTTGLTSSNKTEDINLTAVDHTKLSATAANIPTGKGAVTISRDVTAPTLGAPVLSADYTTLTIPVSEAIDVTSGTINSSNFTVTSASGTPITVKSATLTNPTTIKVVLNNAFPSGESGTVTYVAAGSSNAITIKDVSKNANEMADGANADFGTAVDATAPSFVSAETTTSNTIVVHTNRALDALPGNIEDLFTVSINGTTETASSVALLSADSNKGVTITTTSPIAKGNAVKVTYTPDATDASKNVKGENGKPLAGFADESVDYSVPATPITTIVLTGGSLQKKYYTTDSIADLTVTANNFSVTTPFAFSVTGTQSRGTALTASFKVTANDEYDFNGLTAAALASAWSIDADMITVTLSENDTVAEVTINFGTVKEKINSAIALTGFSSALSAGDELSSVTPATTVDGVRIGDVTWTEASAAGEVSGTVENSKTYTAHIAVSADDDYEFDTTHTITLSDASSGGNGDAQSGTFRRTSDTKGEIAVLYGATA